MRSRRRRTRAIAWLLAARVVLAAPAAGAQSVDGLPDSRFVEVREPLSPDYPIYRFLIAREAAAQTERVIETTHAAVALLSDWFGPPPPPITVAGVPWSGSISATSRQGIVTVPVRWLTPDRDRSMERALIGGLLRWYWSGATGPDGTFKESLVRYASGRAVDQLLEYRNFATPRYLGGFVPFPLRSVLLSPPPSDPRPRAFGFDESEQTADAGVVRGVRALQTIERYVGWPTLLAALSKMRTATTATGDAGSLAAALSEARGTDLRFLVTECFRSDAVFDYALADLQSRPAAGLVETTLTVVRQGPGQFATRSASGDRNPLMPVRVRFADGSEIRDFFDGAVPSTSLVYTAKTAAVSATVDPDVILLLDLDRANNAIVRDARTAPLGIRLALNWMAWLQNAMLTYTAIV